MNGEKSHAAGARPARGAAPRVDDAAFRETPLTNTTIADVLRFLQESKDRDRERGGVGWRSGLKEDLEDAPRQNTTP